MKIKIPENIEIAGRKYKIKKSHKISNKEGVYGKIYYDRCEILLDNDTELSQQSIEITFLHECIHGIFKTLNIDNEEKTVDSLAEMMYQVIKQI